MRIRNSLIDVHEANCRNEHDSSDDGTRVGRVTKAPRHPKYGHFKPLLLTVVFLVLATAWSTAGESLRTLTILHTNDVHSHLLPFDQVDYGKNVGGAARLYELVKKIASETPNCLLLDGGDLFQGTPFYSSFFGEVETQVADLIGYTATVLGNHDLDDGLANVRKQYASSSVQLLCANVFDESTGSPTFTPWLIADRGDIKIGVIGAIGSEAWSVISRKRQRGMVFQDHEPIVASIAAFLRPQVDLVVFLSHAGYDSDLVYAAQSPDIDIIVGGHTNNLTPQPVLVKHLPRADAKQSRNGLNGTIVVQAFKWGVFLGRLDLILRPDDTIATYSGHLSKIDASIPVSDINPVARLVDSYHERIKAMTSQLIGHCSTDMLYPDEEKHLKVFPIGVWACEAMREFVGADFGIINSGTIRDGIASGPVTMGTLLSVLPFDNTIVTYRMKGRDIEAMLSYIAANHGRITGYQYAGLGFTAIVGSGTVQGLTIGGLPVDPERMYHAATISYLADGNQNGLILFKNAVDRHDTGFLMRDVAIERLRKSPQLVPPSADGIRFVTTNTAGQTTGTH